MLDLRVVVERGYGGGGEVTFSKPVVTIEISAGDALALAAALMEIVIAGKRRDVGGGSTRLE